MTKAKKKEAFVSSLKTIEIPDLKKYKDLNLQHTEFTDQINK